MSASMLLPNRKEGDQMRPMIARITPLDRARALAERSHALLVIVAGDDEAYLQQSQIIQDAIRSGMESMASSALESRR